MVNVRNGSYKALSMIGTMKLPETLILPIGDLFRGISKI